MYSSTERYLIYLGRSLGKTEKLSPPKRITMSKLSKRKKKKDNCCWCVHRIFVGYIKGNLRGRAGGKEGYGCDGWKLGSWQCWWWLLVFVSCVVGTHWAHLNTVTFNFHSIFTISLQSRGSWFIRVGNDWSWNYSFTIINWHFLCRIPVKPTLE